MKNKEFSKWLFRFVTVLTVLTILLPLRFYLMVSLPYVFSYLVSISIYILIVFYFISLTFALLRIKFRDWFMLKPFIAIGVIVICFKLIFYLNATTKGKTISRFCISNEKKLNALVDYANRHNINFGYRNSVLNNQNNYILYSCCNYYNHYNDVGFYDNQFDSMLTELNIEEYINKNNIIFLNYYKAHIPCYGYGISYAANLETGKDQPVSYKVCPIHGWYKIINNWYYYSYLD